MANKFAKGSFHFRRTKNAFFIFRVPKVGSFCEGSTKYLMSIWTNPFLYYTRPPFINKLQKFPCEMFLMHLCWKRQIAANSAGTGWNLNYKCLIVCSLFFQKIICKCTSTHFIRDLQRVLQDSTPSYHRPCPPSPVLTVFWNRCLNNSKKNQKNIKPSRCILIYVLVTIQTNKLGIMQIY